MVDLQREMASLSKHISDLETALGARSAELAELTHLMGSFLVRYQQEVLYYHDQLVKLQRDIADARVLQGYEDAKGSAEGDTPLNRLVRSPAFRPVQEQYERMWKGKKQFDLTDFLPPLPPAPDQLKAAYSEVVARLHPDLGDTASERRRRQAMMHDVNKAYIKRNTIGMQGVADAMRDRGNLPTVVTEATVKDLRSRTTLLEWAIVRLEGQIYELRYGDIAKLLILSEQAKKQDRDLIHDLSQDIQRDLEAARHELAALQGRQ